MAGDSNARVDMFNGLENAEKLELLFNKSLQWEEDGKDLEILIKETDQFFLIVIAIIIFFMQCGFAFLEAGSVRYACMALYVAFFYILSGVHPIYSKRVYWCWGEKNHVWQLRLNIL